MQWSESWGEGHEPSYSQIREFVDTPLWDDLANRLEQSYNIQPKLFYSGCSMQNGLWKGWNVKYKKSGKSLCTLYPMQGYFSALVVIGAKEMQEAEFTIVTCSDYMKSVFVNTQTWQGQKWLMIDIKDESTVCDIMKLIALRVKPKRNEKAKV